MNWTFVSTAVATASATAIISLGSQVNLGMAVGTTGAGVQAQVADVLVAQAQPADGSLHADFTASVTQGEAPLTVRFDAGESYGAGELSYTWWFGDGERAEGPTAQHTFNEPGEYAVILTVKNAAGSRTATRVVTVTGDTPASVLQVPFAVDEQQVAGGAAISTQAGRVMLESATTVPVLNFHEGRSSVLFMLDSDSHEVAVDVLWPGRKEHVLFNAENTVRGKAVHVLAVDVVPFDHIEAVYYRLDEHPHFDAAVRAVREAKRMDETDLELLRLIHRIARETAVQYYIEVGLLVPEGDGWKFQPRGAD